MRNDFIFFLFPVTLYKNVAKLVSTMPLFLSDVILVDVVIVVVIVCTSSSCCSPMNSDRMHSNIVNTRESDYKHFVRVLGTDAHKAYAKNCTRPFSYTQTLTHTHHGNTMEIAHVCLCQHHYRPVYFIHLILLQIRCYMLLFTMLKCCCAEESPCGIPNKKAPKEQKLNTKILVQIGNAERRKLSYNCNRLKHYIYAFAHAPVCMPTELWIQAKAKKIHC